MTVRVKFSDSHRAKLARIKKLPMLGSNAMYGLVKRDVVEINILFHDGIKKHKLGLDRLSPVTVGRKERMGYEKPKHPLYGAGDSEGNRSYAGMMNITNIKNGYKLAPSRRLHHSRKKKLKELFDIHEPGAIIRKHTKNGIILIRIPPRPAFRLAQMKWKAKRKNFESRRAKEVRKALTDFVNTGNAIKLKDWAAYQKTLNEYTRTI